MSPIHSEILRSAQADIGVREIGTSNTGPEVNAYLASTGLGPGQPWCAAFVYYHVSTVCKRRGVAVPIPKTAYCPTLEADAKKRGVLRSSPAAGDIFLMYSSPEGWRRASHTGFVLEVLPGGRFKTVEGNTNNSGSRSGIGVFSLTRAVGANLQFIRLADLLPAGASVVDAAQLARRREGYQARLHDHLAALYAALPGVLEGEDLQAAMVTLNGFNRALTAAGCKAVPRD